VGEIRIIGEKPELRYHDKIPQEREITWHKNNTGEIAHAEEVFKRCLIEGWIAYTVTSDDRKTQIFTFDPELELIVIVPILYGG
jgi:hypothetical protein